MTGLEPLLLSAGVGASTASAIGTGAAIASVAGTGLSAIGSIQQGRANARSANFEAEQMAAAAKQTEAKATRDALEQKRQINLARSRAVAIGAADGSLAAPTVANILGGLDQEADTAFQNTLIQGQEQGQTMRTGAEARRIEGRQAKKAGLYSAVGSLTGLAGSAGAQSLASKYGSGIIKGSSGSSTIR